MKTITRRSALLAAASTPVLALPSIAQAGNPDAELIRLGERHTELEQYWTDLDGQIDGLYSEIPPDVRRARVQIGTVRWEVNGWEPEPVYAQSESEVNRADLLSDRHRADLIAELRDKKARYKAARKAKGIPELERLKDAALAEQSSIYQQIVETPAHTREGYAVKLAAVMKLMPGVTEDMSDIAEALRSLAADMGVSS